MLALNNNNSVDSVDSVIVFYIIPSFTHSSLVLNRSEKEGGKPNSCWSSVTYTVFFLFLLKSMWTSNCLVFHLLQNTLFCVQHKKEMNTGLGQHVSE